MGKSSLLKRFTDGIYSDVADPTVGVDFYARSLDIEPGVKIKLQLWDTAGQERFRLLLLLLSLAIIIIMPHPLSFFG